MHAAIIAMAGSFLLATVPPDIKTVEASPSGGLTYRVIMRGSAAPDAPSRLIVWLHPTGGLMLDIIGEMAPVFIRCGFAVLMASDKSPDGWSDLDIGKLMNVTLRDAGKIPGIDARKPILMGFSGGGQAVLALWLARTSLLGGVIVDAAYPVQLVDGKYVPADLPAGEAVKHVPLFVVVGAQDQAVSIWRQVEKPWRDSGVPLTIHYIPGKGHTWLFDESVTSRLEEWLKSLPAGRAAPP